MNLYISLFFLLGFCFGLLTYSNRHFFSEGPSKRDDDVKADLMTGRLMWTLVCTMLWPIMVLTGLHTWWLLARRRAVAAMRQSD